MPKGQTKHSSVTSGKGKPRIKRGKKNPKPKVKKGKSRAKKY